MCLWRIGRHDPTYDRVVEGRAIYNDAVKTSGGGSNGCFSCHPDLASDGIAWDLSAYHDDADSFTVDNPPEFWRDRKQSMTTQDCRSLEDSAPYHWRGEQKDLEDFNSAIGNLQKAPLLPADEMTLVKDYVFSAVYAANPDQPLDRVFSPDALTGSNTFQHEHWTETESACNDCHTLPLGSRGAINGRLVVGEITAAEHRLKGSSSPQMRGLWTKQSDHANLRETGPELLVPVTGFGVNHTGSHRDVAHYVRRQFTGFSDPQMQESIISFLTEFDSGLAPMSNFSYRLDQATAAGFEATFYLDQTMALNCDLAARGRLQLDGNWRDVGLFFDRTLQAFVSDDSGEAPISLDSIVSMAEAGQETTATAFVRIVNNRHEPVPDATIHGMWTLFVNGDPVAQIPGDSGLTDADGNAEVETTFNVAVEGMEIDFTVPMYRGPLGQDLPGVLDTVFKLRRFAWSDNVVSSVRVAIP